ncbi:acidic mammalian chitinase-like [Cylas formicarius]|uniref:acidic mammalian chitinase-like n=1 Tax=Cylas formicarius TaxID=197179 RepID=UPI0029585113|nr:acidic mammalian chitinase-like [Cylas formicarius]
MLSFKVLSCFLLFSLGSLSIKGDNNCDTKTEIVCYYGSWAIYRPDIGLFSTENIDPNLCTRIVYTFIGLDINLKLTSIDSYSDIDLGGFKNVTSLKEKNPCLKVVVAIGGWNEGSLKYSVMASTATSREEFANNALKFLAYYGFDGLDLDWEYPGSRGGISDDKGNFALLLGAVREKFEPWGFQLSIAVSIDESIAAAAYDVSAINGLVDYVHLMAYDYTTGTSDVTGLIAPLSAIKTSVNFWLDQGLSASKLVLGIPTYARYFVLEDENNHDLGAPVEEKKYGGTYTGEDGFLAYYERKMLMASYPNCKTVTEDSNVYSYCEDEWMTYDTEETVAVKTQYALDLKLGGVMVWSLDTDDFSGYYGTKYPLLTAIYHTINGS